MKKSVFQWCDERGIRYKWAAPNLFGVHYVTLWKVNRTGHAGKRLAEKIYEVTGGECDYRS